MFDDFKSCYKRLQFFNNLVEQIIQKIGTRDRLSGVDREETQGLLRELKGELKKDIDFMGDGKVQDTLSDIDRNFYYPAVKEALSRIKIRKNLAPGRKWINPLYDAQESINHCMELLENYL